jgi:small subunit ribosomal protein S2
MDRLRAKLDKNLGSIADMTRLPGALFVVDIKREHIAIKEAQKLNIPIFAMVDTNSDPRQVDYLIPSNDDASKSIDKVVGYVSAAIIEGLSERKAGKDAEDKDNAAAKSAKAETAKTLKAKAEKTEAPKAEVVAEAPKAKATPAAKPEPAKAKVAASEEEE